MKTAQKIYEKATEECLKNNCQSMNVIAITAIENAIKERNEDIEKEIQAQVEFKMKELLTGIENRAKTNWGVAMQTVSQKHTYYWEAFKELKQMFRKEIEMPLPCDEMVLQNKKVKKNQAVDKIMNHSMFRTANIEREFASFIANTIEEAQNY